MSDKKFCGSGRILETKYGILPKISFSKSDLEVLRENLNENGWVSANMKEKRETVVGKPTHYLEIDDWKPNSNSEYKKPEEHNHFPEEDPSELPF